MPTNKKTSALTPFESDITSNDLFRLARQSPAAADVAVEYSVLQNKIIDRYVRDFDTITCPNDATTLIGGGFGNMESVLIDYSITRGLAKQGGLLKIVNMSSVYGYDFFELGHITVPTDADLGITFTVYNGSTNVALFVTTTNSGATAYFKYSIIKMILNG